MSRTVGSKNGRRIDAGTRFKNHMDALENRGGGRIQPYLSTRGVQLLRTVMARRDAGKARPTVGTVVEEALQALHTKDLEADF